MSLKQIQSMTAMALSSVPARIGSSTVIVFGLAAVVAVLVSALAVADGFARAAQSTGRADRAIIISADREFESSLSRDDVQTIANAPGIRHLASGEALLSAEFLTFVGLRDPGNGLNVYASIRGIGSQGLALRPEVKIVEGMAFRPGSREMIIGRALWRRLGGMGVGSKIPMPNGPWLVTGVFESGGDAHESELLTSSDTLLNANRRNAFTSMTVALETPASLTQLKDSIAASPSLSAVRVLRENEYYEAVSRGISSLMMTVAIGIGGLMAFGAVFAALNTMYTAVSTRTTEIGTLQAIGFGSGAVVCSVILEALLLALVGALGGALISWLLLDGASVSTISGMSRSQLTFELHVGTVQLITGTACALVVALIGGSLAAARAARMSVVDALRSV